jgi:hypothetical protein
LCLEACFHGNLGGGSPIANIAALPAEPSAESALELPKMPCEIAEIAANFAITLDVYEANMRAFVLAKS